MTVTGIVAPPPANSSIQFDLIGSFATQREQQWMIRNNPWNMRSFPTYLRLAKGVDREDLAAAIPSLLMTHTTSESVTRYELEPLRSIYLDSVGGDGGLGISGDEHDVYLFATTATLVLLLACINYTNLATARSTRRAREVGVRKAIGAHPASLRMQFMGESVAMCLTAGLIGAMIAELGTELLQRMEAITLADLPWTDPVFVAGYVGVAILTGLMSGLYPALFSIATALLVGVLVIRQQLQYIQDQRLGLQTQQVLAIDNHGGLDLAQSRIFRQELRRNAAILSASASSALPSRGHTSRTIEIEGTEEEYWIAEYHADEELISTLGIDIIEGRGLTEQDEILSARHLVINQTAANNFGWEKPLNQTISFNGDAWRVVGVMADFHTESMRSRVWPLMLGPSSEWGFDYLVVRLKPDELVAGIDHIERTWARFVPDQPLQTRWLDQSFANLYTRERQLGWLFTLFSGVAILIASVGLYGLAAYAAQARTTYRVEVGPFTFVIAGVLVTVIAALTVGHQSIRAALTDPVKTLRCE